MFTWWAFGQSPEELAFLGLQVEGVGEQQLLDVVAIVNKEFSHCFGNAIVEGFRSVLYHSGHCFTLLSLQD